MTVPTAFRCIGGAGVIAAVVRATIDGSFHAGR